VTPPWPSVGVIIPTRNRRELLARAVEGVVAQDYAGPVRIIVVYDQNSPDPAICRGGERPLDVLPNLRTTGLAGARNTGIVALDTDLVAFCDDDDVWAPGKLRRQVAALKGRPQAEFVTSAIEVEYDTHVTPRLAGATLVGIDDLARSRMAMLHSSTFLVRRRALMDDEEIGLVAEDAPGSQNEDWDLLLRAARRGPIVHVDEPLVRVLWGRTSLFAYEYATTMASLRWMMARHPAGPGDLMTALVTPLRLQASCEAALVTAQQRPRTSREAGLVTVRTGCEASRNPGGFVTPAG
jgi:glycosyltransferase involved in cell wall biosynthesis